MNIFAEQLAKFGAVTEQRVKDTFVNATKLVAESLLDGSDLTGAPGQPVGNYKGGGKLKASFQQKFEGLRWTITTDTLYAEYIELGANDIAFFDPARGAPRSDVGGYHSIALTEASYADRIIPHAVAQAIAGKTDG